MDVLEFLKNSGHKFTSIYNEINIAIRFGHVNVLNWFKNSGYDLKCDNDELTFDDKKKLNNFWYNTSKKYSY
ncbi:MAG: hypothetical protein EBQ92_08500 [Proteobacteria bacterium]|nr:hypothetical protein [Pseudomonadota bacterium]